MKNPTPTQIAKILRAADEAIGRGQTVEAFCRQRQISTATYYRWRQHYGGLSVTAAKRLKQLETENTRLKTMLAEVLLANDTLQGFLAKKTNAGGTPCVGVPIANGGAVGPRGLSLRRLFAPRGPICLATTRPRPPALAANAASRGAQSPLWLSAGRHPEWLGLRPNVAALETLSPFDGSTRSPLRASFRLAPQRRRPKRPSGTATPRPCQATHPRHVWTYDLLFDQLADGRPFKVLTVLDEFTRECVAQWVAFTIQTDDSLPVLQQAFRRYGPPEFLRSDNGSEFTAQDIQAWLQRYVVGPTFIPPGQPWQNGFIESCHDKFRDECLDREWFTSLEDARVAIAAWRRKYNYRRPHSSLGYQTPAGFAAKHLTKRAKALTSRGNKR